MFKKGLAILIFITLFLPVMAEAKVFVLAFHTFTGNEKSDYDIDVKSFRLELEKLKKEGFTFVTMEEIKANKVTGSKNLLMTIDDGHKTVVRAYDEVLKPMGIKPVLGIYPSVISVSKSFMTWEDVNRLSKDGVYIASHGYNHLLTNHKLYDKDNGSFEDEIVKSKKILEEKTGRKIDAFIYPYGVKSDIAKKYLRNSGYKMAFTINWGTLNVPFEKNGELMELPRYMFTKKEWQKEVNIIKSRAK